MSRHDEHDTAEGIAPVYQLQAAAAGENELEATALPPELATLVLNAQAFTEGAGEVDHPAIEVEAEELDTAELAEVVAILDNVGTDLHEALQRLAPAVRLHTQEGPSAISLAEALQALTTASRHLRYVASDLDPTHTGGEQ